MVVGPRVIVYIRQGCHLCPPAVEAVARVCREFAEHWQVIDIDDPPAVQSASDLVRQHGEHVPVVVVDGVQQSMWTVEEDRLRRALTAG